MKTSVAVRQKFHGFQLAQQLANRHTLENLYTSYYGRFFGRDNSIGYNIKKDHIQTNLISTIRTYLLNDHSFENDDKFGRWVASRMEHEDIIVTWGIQALPIIKRAHQMGIKVVLERGSAHATEQRDILMEEYKTFNIDTSQLEKSFSEKRMERELMEYEMADMVSIPSSFVKRSFLKYGFDEKKLFVNAFGADVEYFNYAPISHKPFRLIYAGALSIQKGIYYLLKAFSELSLTDAELWLVGKQDEEIKPILLKYASERIKVFEPVPQNQLAFLYNQCDAFVICSLQEGMAMVQLQAMACGLPLICTTNTGGDDLIESGNEGFVIPIRDIRSLKEKIIFLRDNEDDCKNMGQKALLKVQNGFTWTDYGSRALKAYSALL
jgi:glycosyltransferase involved in cell wall biosynthesis